MTYTFKFRHYNIDTYLGKEIIALVPCVIYQFFYIQMRSFYKNFLGLIGVIVLSIGCQKKEILSSEKRILSFKISENASVIAQIDDNLGVIRLSVPYGTNPKKLTPLLTVSDRASLVPASEVPQDFSKPVYYTLTAEDGSKVIYTVKLSVAPQPAPILTNFDKDTLDAGQNLRIVGKYFGSFVLDVAVNLVSSTGQKSIVSVKEMDSTFIVVEIPIDTPPGNYRCNVQVKALSSVSPQAVVVALPVPTIRSVSKFHLLQGDTLWIGASHTDVASYAYQLYLQASARDMVIPLAKEITSSQRLGFVIPNQMPPNVYGISLFNQTQQKKSSTYPTTVQIYDAQKAFIRDIDSPKDSYIKGETLSFKTLNMATTKARLFQVGIVGKKQTYFKNAIYDAKSRLIVCQLPEEIVADTYRLNVTFLHDNPLEDYTVTLDRSLVIR